MTETTGAFESIDQPALIEFDIINSQEKQVVRAKAAFHANGCAWRERILRNTNQRPCHMYCQWPEMTSELSRARGSKVQNDEFLAQTDTFVEAITLNTEETSRAEVYIGGSHLNPKELPHNILAEMYRRIAAIPSIKEIVLEAHILDLSDEKLDALEQLASETGTKCVISVGIETTNEAILKDARKGINRELITSGIRSILQRKNLIPQAYLLMKPTVMSESAAIDQIVKDVQFLDSASAQENISDQKLTINIAPVSAMKGSGAALNNAYQASSLWSVIEIIKKLRDDQEFNPQHSSIFFGISTEEGTIEKEVGTCPECENRVREAITRFNATYDPNSIDSLDGCDCKDAWIESIQRNEPIVGTVHYPYDVNNPASVTLYNRQVEGIMQVEEAAFSLKSQATRKTMEERIHATGGKFQTLAYNPSNGEIIAYCITKRMKSEDLEAIPFVERGWDQMNTLPFDPDGDILRGISIASKPDNTMNAAKHTVYPVLFDVVDNENLYGLTGVARLPGLAAVKDTIENTIGGALTEEELFDVAQQYVEAHFTGEKSRSLTVTFRVRDHEICTDCHQDSNMRFWGDMPFTEFGPIVFSMENDPESCGLGVYLMYRGKEIESITTQTNSSLNRVTQT